AGRGGWTVSRPGLRTDGSPSGLRLGRCLAPPASSRPRVHLVQPPKPRLSPGSCVSIPGLRAAPACRVVRPRRPEDRRYGPLCAHRGPEALGQRRRPKAAVRNSSFSPPRRGGVARSDGVVEFESIAGPPVRDIVASCPPQRGGQVLTLSPPRRGGVA